MAQEIMTEEILTELSNNYVLFPIKYQSIWNMYKKALSSFWTAEEIDLSKDMNDWEKLTENERHFIKHVLAFFAGSDGIVNENLSVRFMNEVKPQEAKAFYGFQIAMENIHCVTGNTQILTDQGYMAIGPLVDKQVNVWNGKQFSKVTIVKTSDAAPTSTVILDNGMFLTCTSEHKWLIKQDDGSIERVFTKDLIQNKSTIAEFAYPSADDQYIQYDPDIFANPRDHGMQCTQDESQYNPIRFECRPMLFVPINYTNKTKATWLSGLFSSLDITDIASNPDIMFEFKHSNAEFINLLQLLLTTLNVLSDVVMDQNHQVMLIIDAFNIKQLLDCGVIFKPNNTVIRLPEIQKCALPLKVVGIIENTVMSPTFCFNEPLEHAGVFNGILTGQSETYSLLIDSYIKDSSEKTHLLDAINTIPCIAQKANWAIKWINDKNASFAQRLLGFALVEGVFFSGAFCAIFWLKERGVMPGLCLSNEFISRDEGLHTEFAVLLYSMLENKMQEEDVYEMVKDAVVIEDEFINDSIPCSMLGMNRDLMSQYIRFVADRLVIQLGYTPIWNVKNPFDFMDRIGLDGKDNFFEHTRNSNYARANVSGKQTEDNFKLVLDADF